MRARLWLCLDPSAQDAQLLQINAQIASECATQQGITAALWLRMQGPLSSRAYLALASQCRAIADRSLHALVVGDRCDVALLCAADALHVSSRSPNAYDARRYFDRLFASVSDTPEITASVHAGDPIEEISTTAQCLLAAPFAAVPSKSAPLGEVGLRGFKTRAPASRLIALGGLHDPTSISRALSAGADAIAIRSPMLSPNIADSLSPILRALAELPA
ncbi:MAG: thiamine phosphate synthase [Deltaproteobacteria bacterium]|nr:thiamine phosphate synthase [Deltaproteobacteria bacterium]